jgi:hypothetical protein
MGKRKTRKRSRRGGEPIKVFGAYLGDETCAWYETVGSCSNGKCSAGRIKGKEKEKCGDPVNFTTSSENISKFDPFTASATMWGSLVFKQSEKYKTSKLPEEMEGKKLINANEMKDGFNGQKNVYYIIHEEKSSSTNSPRWGLRVFRNCDVTKKDSEVTIKYPDHTNKIHVKLSNNGTMILKWGSKETPDVKYGTLLFGDSTAGGRKRRRRSTKKRRRSTKKKRRKKRKRTKKKRRRR